MNPEYIGVTVDTGSLLSPVALCCLIRLPPVWHSRRESAGARII